MSHYRYHRKGCANSLHSMKRLNETIENTIKVCYRLFYFWHFTFIDINRINKCHDKTIIWHRQKKIENYIISQPLLAI